MSHLFSHRTRGQAAILATLGLVTTLGSVSLVMDMGWAYYRKTNAMVAAEAAAIGAATAASVQTGFTCGLNVTCTESYTACPASPTSPPSDYLQSGCLYAKTNGFVNSG